MRDLSGWIDFFESAGVPPAVRKTYAQIFVDHRITDSVVADLEKDHLKDMGITVIGDIIAILKQCKKTGHEDPAASTPKVSSTTPRNTELPKRKNDSSTAQSAVVSSGDTVSARRCMTPEIEGKYIVKHPSGTTAKTRRILATLKQKAAATDGRVKSAKHVQPNTGVPAVSPVFDDGDADEQMNYRVILSKAPAVSASSSSVFARLGASVSAGQSLSPSKNTAVVQRLIQRSIDISPETSAPQPHLSTGRTLLSSYHRSQAHPGSANTNGNRPAARTVIAGDGSKPISRAQKRPASDSVFSRLSSSSAESPRFQQPGGVDRALGYHGVLKQARVSQSPVTVRKPIEYPAPHKSANPRSAFVPKPLTYSEGVLGTAIKPISWNESSVKSRLGHKNNTNTQLTGRSVRVTSVHSRLGKNFNPT